MKGKSYKVVQVSGKNVLLAGISSWTSRSNVEILLTTSSAAKIAVPSSTVYYTIQAGNTLSGIAAKYGTTVAKLAYLNGLKNANYIYAGQTLRIK